MNKTIHVGLVGFGFSGQVFHAPFVHSHPNLQLTKVVERTKSHSKELYPYTEVVRDFDELLEDKAIDLVIITTANELHYPMVKKALLKNKHVVVEKPFTISSEEATQLAKLANKQNRVLSVYHNRRFDGDFLTINQIIQQNLLGHVVEFESHYDRYRNFLKGSWREDNRPGSGILYDLGSHLIDQAITLFGYPHTVTADVRIQRPISQTIDSFDLKLDYDNLKILLKAGMLVREPGPRFIIHGTNGSFVKYEMDPQEEQLKNGMMPTNMMYGIEKEDHWGTLNTDLNELHYKGKIETMKGNYMNFYNNIYDSIVNDMPLIVTGEQACNTIRIIELAMQSSEEGRSIPFTPQLV
ncbi:oxidoreductase [Cytobacillus sp. Hm23]